MGKKRGANEEKTGDKIEHFPVEEDPPEMEYGGSSQAPSSQKTIMSEGMKALLEEAAERGARAAIRWMKGKENQRDDNLEALEVKTRPGDMEASVRSSKAPKSPGSPKKEEKTHQWEDLKREISDLRKCLEPRMAHPRRGNPFSEEILSVSLPSHVRIPQLACYGGERGDPRDHVDQFIAAMDLIDSNDALHCRIFRTTLVGRAQTWFSRLPSGSIRSFVQLVRGFIQHFASNQRYPKNSSHLFSIIQEDGEPLRSYIQRFANEILDIPDISPEFLSGIMAQGLRNGGLADSLIGDPAPNWDELLAQAEKFILIEESRKLRGPPRPRKDPIREIPKRNPEGVKDDPRRRVNPYTPLNMTRTQALLVVEKSEHLRWPPKMKENEYRQRSSKYCNFHQDRGNTTEECIHLKEELERLVQMGPFSKITRSTKQETPSHKRRREIRSEEYIEDFRKRPHPSSRIINVIEGGHYGGTTKSSRKRHLREITYQVFTNSAENHMGEREICPITFTPEDEEGITFPHEDAVVISATISNMEDSKGVWCDPWERYTPYILGRRTQTEDSHGPFLVVNTAHPNYNVILGRSTLNAFRAVISTSCIKIKFPMLFGMGEVRGDQIKARECRCHTLKQLEQQNKEPQGEKINPAEGTTCFQLENSNRKVKIGTNLSTSEKDELGKFLQENQEVFEWEEEKVTGIPEHVVQHELNVFANAKPTKQKKRSMGRERNLIIHQEVERLLKAGHIREVRYPDWIANVVLVPKPGGKWCMCVDFTDLNKACPKDPYPLPRIDQLVDSTTGCERLSMLDAYQGYNQIKLAKEDQEKTSFITKRGLYCYNVMPFGLKNARATYQRKSIKAQALADFIAECPQHEITTEEVWDLFVDGSVAEKRAGGGVVLKNSPGHELKFAIRFEEPLSNNETEYEALLCGLEIAKENEVRRIKIHCDSQLMVEQVSGGYEAKDDRMRKLVHRAQNLLSTFQNWELVQISRNLNNLADILARMGSRVEDVSDPQVTLIPKASRKNRDEVARIETRQTEFWMDAIRNYLEYNKLPTEILEAQGIKRLSARFFIEGGHLFKKSFTLPSLRCLTPEEAWKVMQEIHEGCCGNHVGGRSQAQKVMR
ncbi:UNVERIFIED_CONTAM: Transposon Ty3-G Gag-Pol polyprotein [Sesamum radiatum]|uniref:Transposon Ty3-G Gag-Pol polyprotein n=1 Tax=Sesamum radiatum TaxID=300843 RepID=A0AAW2PGZ8_SESRA